MKETGRIDPFSVTGAVIPVTNQMINGGNGTTMRIPIEVFDKKTRSKETQKSEGPEGEFPKQDTKGQKDECVKNHRARGTRKR